MACHSRNLIRSQFASVDFCSCGKYHLHCGPLTLRFEEEAMQGLVHLLGKALMRRNAEKEPERSSLIEFPLLAGPQD
jgi:hypothetical protein